MNIREFFSRKKDSFPTVATVEHPSAYSIDSSFEQVDSSSWLTEYSELFYNETEDYWEPPISPEGLAQLHHANAYHCAIVVARGNYIASRFLSDGNIRKQLVQRFTRDYIQFGWGAFLKIRDRLGRVISLYPLPAMHLRKQKNGNIKMLERDDKFRIYKQDDVIWLNQYDPKQQIYGLADYVGGMQSNLLNKDSTLFRRRYYKNGAHLGYIFYSTDPKLKAEDEQMMKDAIANSKGVGNFRSMYVNIPNGHEKGIQLIPIGNLSTKDEFEAIKNITAQDILVSHRFPPGMGGIVPTNTAGFGDIQSVSNQYMQNEIIPICNIIEDEVNNDPEIISRPDLQLKFNLDVA